MKFNVGPWLELQRRTKCVNHVSHGYDNGLRRTNIVLTIKPT